MSISKSNNPIFIGLKILKMFVILTFVAVIMMLLFSMLYVKDHQERSLLNHRFFIVLSDSMAPKFNAGDLIITKIVDTETLVEGDIITFYSMDPLKYQEIITHQIVEITEDDQQKLYITKGLNNTQNDLYPVLENNVIGKYQSDIPKLGLLMNYMRQDSGYILFILVPCVILVVLELLSMMRQLSFKQSSELNALRKENERLKREIIGMKRSRKTRKVM